MKNPTTLEQLLRRGDIWRGHSRTFIPQAVHNTGFNRLDRALLNGGWPRSNLIECSLQHNTCGGEWLLFTPLLQALCAQQQDGWLVLLNPPAIPFAPALIQNGIPLNQLLVVESNNKQDFIASFIEFTRSAHCLALLAWQMPYKLNYTELRKCQLACAEGPAIYTLFRPTSARNQSSPAPLRLGLAFSSAALVLDIFKQRGLFTQRQVILTLGEELAEGQLYENQAQHL